MPTKSHAKLKKVSIKIPWVGEAEWEADQTQTRAAWSLYVELVTRVSIQPVEEERTQYRDILSSLHTLFPTTRQILKDAGPDAGASQRSLGGVAINVLNKGLRPFLTRWHPRLLDWESGRPADVSPRDHEQHWPDGNRFKAELDEMRRNLGQYALALAAIAGTNP